MKKLICSLMVGTMIFGTVSTVASAVSHKKTDKGFIARIVERNREKNHKENLRRAIEINWDELFPNILGTPVVSESSSGSGSPDSSIMGDAIVMLSGSPRESESPDSSIMEDAIAMRSPMRTRGRRSSIMGDPNAMFSPIRPRGRRSSAMRDDASFGESVSSIMRGSIAAMLSPIMSRRSSAMRDGASVDGGESSIMGDDASFDEGGSSIMR